MVQPPSSEGYSPSVTLSYAEPVQPVEQAGRIGVHPEGTRPPEFLPAIPARQEPDAERAVRVWPLVAMATGRRAWSADNARREATTWNAGAGASGKSSIRP
jgi:hypothetical protein